MVRNDARCPLNKVASFKLAITGITVFTIAKSAGGLTTLLKKFYRVGIAHFTCVAGELGRGAGYVVSDKFFQR